MLQITQIHLRFSKTVIMTVRINKMWWWLNQNGNINVTQRTWKNIVPNLVNTVTSIYLAKYHAHANANESMHLHILRNVRCKPYTRFVIAYWIIIHEQLWKQTWQQTLNNKLWPEIRNWNNNYSLTLNLLTRSGN